LKGNPPNLDVVLNLSDGHVIGIESKYSEWLTAKSPAKKAFDPKYFPNGDGLWTQRGLSQSQRLAQAIDDGDKAFRYLDVPQLLKHSLGMARRLGEKFSLCYLYYGRPGNESERHENEITEFAALVGDELRFTAMSYQKLFERISSALGVEVEYSDYLRSRYFPGGGR
jgi:restriction endonuclease-like protein